MKMKAKSKDIPHSQKQYKKVGTLIHLKRDFMRYLTKSGAPDIVPFKKKKHFFMADPNPRGMNELCSFMEMAVYTRKGVVVFDCKFQFYIPKDLLFTCYYNCLYCISPCRNLVECLCNFFLLFTNFIFP